MPKTIKAPNPKAPAGSPPVVRTPPARVEPDWQAYFMRFVEAHAVEGGGPVIDGGVFLFGDGWRYALAYEGPEFPPPGDVVELIDLQRRYWRRRRAVVKSERDGLAFQLEGLRRQSQERPTPLMLKRYKINEITGGLYRDAADPTQEADGDFWYTMAKRLQWLNDDHDLCTRELRDLGEMT